MIPPCLNCLVFVRCKVRLKNDMFADSIISFAHKEKCPLAIKYVEFADQKDINEMRTLFGLRRVYE